MLIFQGGQLNGLSPEALQQQMGKWMAWVQKLSEQGRYAGGEPLLPGGKVLTGRNEVATDGPFTEGKEVVGGYFIVEAANMDEAVDIARDFPDFEFNGTVQVRQVQKLDM